MIMSVIWRAITGCKRRKLALRQPTFALDNLQEPDDGRLGFRFSTKAYEHNDSLEFIANSMKKCLSHLGPWTIGDLSFGIRALVDQHKGQSDSIDGDPVNSLSVLQELQKDIEIADAIYEQSVSRVVRSCELKQDDVIEFHTNADRLRPAYCIALRPRNKQVLLAVRGTRSPADAVTILTEWLLHNKTGTLMRLMQENAGFKLHFIGHSLGAGAAALYAIMLRQRHESRSGAIQADHLPTCLAVATPACTTRELAESCKDFVTTIVCQNDLVPRASLYAFERLRIEVKKTNWQEDLDELIEDGLRDWRGKLSTSALAGQYKKVAELLATTYPGTAKVVDAVGDAWDQIAKSTSKQYSESLANILGKASIRIAKLPATGKANKRKISYAESEDMLSQTNNHKGSGSEGGPDNENLLEHHDMGQAGRDIKAFARMLRTSEETMHPAQKPIPLASDGDVDAELSELLIDIDESEAKTKTEVQPVAQMYAPGSLVFLHRLSGDSSNGAYEALAGKEGQSFGRIFLSKSMIIDHLGSTYIAAIKSCIRRVQQS